MTLIRTTRRAKRAATAQLAILLGIRPTLPGRVRAMVYIARDRSTTRAAPANTAGPPAQTLLLPPPRSTGKTARSQAYPFLTGELIQVLREKLCESPRKE